MSSLGCLALVYLEGIIAINATRLGALYKSSLLEPVLICFAKSLHRHLPKH